MKKFISQGQIQALLILVVLIPLFNVFGFISDNTLNLWGRYLCFAIAAIGLNLLWGYTGVLSMCQAFFFCLGGYAIGMHMLLETGTESIYGKAIPDFMVWNGITELPAFWVPFSSLSLTIMLAFLVPLGAALIFGFLAFRSRIKGVYFAIITQALALALWLLFLRNETMLGGTNGLTDFKTIVGFDLSEPSTKRGLFVATGLVLVAAYFISKRIVDSKLGRVLIAIRDSEFRLRFTGYEVWKYKVFIFAVAAVFAALGGLLYVPQTGIITPGRMTVQASIEMVIWVALGGRGSLMGPIVGALVISFLYSTLTGLLPGSWLFVLGGLFVSVVLYFPDGLVGVWNRLGVNKLLTKKASSTEEP